MSLRRSNGGLAKHQPADHSHIDDKQPDNRDGPRREARTWWGDAHLEQRRATLPLAVVLGFFQGIKDERHGNQPPPRAGSLARNKGVSEPATALASTI